MNYILQYWRLNSIEVIELGRIVIAVIVISDRISADRIRKIVVILVRVFIVTDTFIIIAVAMILIFIDRNTLYLASSPTSC